MLPDRGWMDGLNFIWSDPRSVSLFPCDKGSRAARHPTSLFMGPSGDFNPFVPPVACGTGARCVVWANEKCHVINIRQPDTIYLLSLLGSYGPQRASASITTNASSLWLSLASMSSFPSLVNHSLHLPAVSIRHSHFNSTFRLTFKSSLSHRCLLHSDGMFQPPKYLLPYKGCCIISSVLDWFWFFTSLARLLVLTPYSKFSPVSSINHVLKKYWPLEFSVVLLFIFCFSYLSMFTISYDMLNPLKHSGYYTYHL